MENEEDHSIGQREPTAEVVVPEKPRAFTKQLVLVLVLCILVLALFRLGAIAVVLTAVFAFLDAWYAGIRKRRDSNSFLNISAAGWGVAILLMLIVAYPIYVFARNGLKRQEGNMALWVLTNVFGVIALAMTGLGILALLASA